MRTSPIVLVTASLLAFGAHRALAQESSTPPAHISFVEGTATIDRNGEVEPVALNMPVVEGDRVRTSAGRVQIAFPDGSAVDLESNSEVEYLGGARVRIYAGVVENRPAVVLQSPSTQYLPADSQSYATDLDQNGTWQYDTTYGNVWYPTVSADWRPYYYGYWSSVPSYGWTWIGYNRWAWPTHHYGRWGYGHNRWFWIPGRVYSSAWVSWGTAPGYVSWCPLGWDSRPVVALSVGYSHGWNAWTIVPRDHFGWRGYPAHRYAVDSSRIAASTPFIVQRSQPLLSVRGSVGSVPARGFNRGSEREGFSRATPTNTAVPRYTNSNLDNRGFTSSSPRAPQSAGVERGRPGTPSPQFRNPAQTPVTPNGNRTYPIERAPQPLRPSYQSPRQTYQPPTPSFSRPVERNPPSQPRAMPRVEGYSRAPAPSVSRPMDHGSNRAPAPPSAPRSTGGGHTGNAPHADRGSSGGSHGSGSHGGSSKGTAVRRPG